MTATRSTKEEKQYRSYRKNAPHSCPFCDISPSSPSFIEETANFVVINNTFPYSMWDGQSVVEHLMVVPKVHTNTLRNLTAAQSKEYLDILRQYEEYGYNVYTRSQQSVTRSIVHHHTHFIKTNNQERSLLILLRRPFYLRGSL